MIRTAKQYVESLNDGRVIYLNGEKIPDITKHPKMQGPINARAMSYVLYKHPKFKDLLTIEEDGDRYLFLWKQPTTAEELIRRRDVYITCMRWGAAMSGRGPDALTASGVVAARMDKQLVESNMRIFSSAYNYSPFPNTTSNARLQIASAGA